jgi:RimJ/RimL family protein N-acetyltransferase
MVLEPLEARHAEELFEGLSDPALYRYIPQEPPTSREALRARFARLESRRSPDGHEVWLNWAARLGSSSQPVGLFEATVQGPQARIAYFVFAAHAGRGLGREGMRAVVDELGQGGVRRVDAMVDTRNLASQRLLVHLGFACVERIPAADHFKGAPSDELRFALDLPA